MGHLSNRDGFGAKVRLYAGSQVQFREVGTGFGWASKSCLPEWFGLPDGAVPDSLVVDWPSGIRTVVYGPAPNQVVLVEEDALVPVLPPPTPPPLRVLAPFPNPFPSAVTLALSLGEPARVRIEIFDLQGRPVRRLLDRRLEAGDHVFGWDGEDARGRPVPRGVYFYRVSSGGTRVVKKLVRY
jgi:hypothetical protein